MHRLTSPTGILREYALELLQPHMKENEQTRLRYFHEGLQRCVSLGLTAVQTNDLHAYKFYRRLQQEGRMPLRVFLTIFYEGASTPIENLRSME